MQVKYKLYSKKYYWILKNKRSHYEFLIKKFFFYKKRDIDKETYRLSSISFYLRNTLFSIFKTVILVVVLLLLERYASIFWERNLEFIPRVLIDFVNIIPIPTYPENRDVIIEMISVIASITGVILALFYPVLATIVSTAYAKVNSSIRDLILREKETQDYFRKLTFVTAFSITILFAFSLGFKPGNLVLFILFLSVLVCLFMLLKIGIGVYTLLEPSNLLSLVFTDLRSSIENVTTNSPNWRDVEFQNYHYKKAYKEINNISLITKLSINDFINEDSFYKSIGTSFEVLNYYLDQKPKISVNSLWFPKAQIHKSFFEADMTLRRLAKQIKSYVQSDTKSDYDWLEDKLFENISEGLQAIIEKEHVEILGNSILSSRSTFNSLSRGLDIQIGEKLLETFLKNISLLLGELTLKENEPNYENNKHELVCINIYCSIVSGFQLSMFDRLREFDSNKISREYDKIDWHKNESIYNIDFIPEMYTFLNMIYEFISNEEYVEGNIVTPDWYHKQHITSNYLHIATNKLNNSVLLFDKYLLQLLRVLDQQDNSLLVSFTSHVCLSYFDKIRYRIEQLEIVLKDVNKLEVMKGEYRWESVDFKIVGKKVNNYERECISLVGKHIEKLALVKWSNKYPDIYAQSYTILTSHLNECFRNNDVEQFKELFPSYLKSVIHGASNVSKSFNDYPQPLQITHQIFIDIMQISGYAYIYSAIYNNNNYWDCVKSEWDANFNTTKAGISLLVGIYEYYKVSLNKVGINFSEKHIREKTLREIVMNLNVTSEDFLVEMFINDEYGYSFYDVTELFIEVYLFTFIESKDATKLFTRDLYDSWMRYLNKEI